MAVISTEARQWIQGESIETIGRIYWMIFNASDQATHQLDRNYTYPYFHLAYHTIVMNEDMNTQS